MLWEQKGETEPVTMTAASARFEASSAMMKDGCRLDGSRVEHCWAMFVFVDRMD